MKELLTPTNVKINTIQANNHPLVHNTNTEHRDSLSPVEKSCKGIADGIGSPIALALAVVLQIIWIGIGIKTKWDPFPFVFLLTCSNVIQLILIFVLAVGQRQSSSHAELRAENDHDAISRLLHHQEVQETILLKIAEKNAIEIIEIREIVAKLAQQDQK